MAWLCSPSRVMPPTQPFIMQQFKIIDPKTKQIFTEVLQEHEIGDIKRFTGWKRTKMESVEFKKLSRTLKENNDHFVDPQFPHSNQMLSREAVQVEIEWMRVREAIQNAVYSKQQTIKTLEKIRLNRKQFERALVMIARSSPSLFKDLLSRHLTPQGIYEFKLFRGGYIRNVVIDDYIPTHGGHPIFVGPARENQVYPMLLEKAIAKVCGSYEQIPQDAQQIMQIIFCGPVNVSMIYQLRQQNKLSSMLRKCSDRHDLTVLISRKQSKIRNYGLNDGQVYHMVGRHSLILNKKEFEDVYELVSQSKLSAWNGRWSLGDAVWGDVEPKKKMELYQLMKNNHSFCMGEADIARHFEELLVFQSMDTNNKDWTDNQSQNGFPSFIAFTVDEEQPVFIRVTTSSKIRQTVFLARQTQHKTYEYIDSFFKQQTYVAELSLHLKPGRYIIAVFHQWFLTKQGRYFVFLSSQSLINLTKQAAFDKDFLAKIVLDYQQRQQSRASQSKTTKIYKMRLALEQMGLGYLYLLPVNSRNRSIKIQIDHDRLQKDDWQVMQPYRNIPLVNINDNQIPQSCLIILCKRQIDWDKKYHFPVAAFKLKQS